MLYVNRVHTDSWSKRYNVADEVAKTKQDTGLISIKGVYRKSSMLSRMTDDVTRPYDVIMGTYCSTLRAGLLHADIDRRRLEHGDVWCDTGVRRSRISWNARLSLLRGALYLWKLYSFLMHR